MINDPQVLYKLMVLYMLRQANLPLSNEQISEFSLSKEYTNYLSLQQVIGELFDAHLIKSSTVRGQNRCEITREGEEALGYFGKDIPDPVKTDIHQFISENNMRLRNEMGITADYKKLPQSTEYEVDCGIREGKSTLMRLILSVPDEEQAQAIANRWQSASQKVYSLVMDELLEDQ